MAVKVRKSREEDLPEILKIFSSAIKYMRLNGNFSQWSDTYPGATHILQDISQGVSYVGVNESGNIVMTFAFILGDDPTYKEIRDGEWLNDSPYGTIHRIASNGEERGMLKTACEYCFNFTDNIRIDTHEDNIPMQKALKDLDFIFCGEISCRDGSPRLAFQKENKQK